MLSILKEKDLSKEIVGSWTTSELVQNFNHIMKEYNRISEYLSSDEVRYCDATNTWDKVKELEEEYKLNKFNLSNIHNEVIKRINTLGKRTYLFGEDKVYTSYVLPKSNDNDSMAFVICNDSEFNALHDREYVMYLYDDIIKLNYRIHRNADNSIKWHNDFPKFDKLTPYLNDTYERYYVAEFNNKYGFIDENGLNITEIKYDSVHIFKTNLAKVEINGKWGIVDYDGDELIECKYDKISLPKYMITSENAPCLAIFSKQFRVVDDASDIPIIVEIDNAFGVINTKGDILIPFSNNPIKFLHNDMVLVNENNKFMLFDWDGTLVTKSKYEGIYYFNENLMKIKQNGCFGLINKAGEEVIPPIYTWISEFRNNIAQIGSKDGCIFIDKNGNIVNS